MSNLIWMWALAFYGRFVEAKSDMTLENVRVLKREQGGGVVSATRAWTCDGVQLEMARYGHPVIDCLMHNGNVWFRIDTAMTWQDSWQACHAIAGGNLASVHSASDYATLRALYWFDQWKTPGNWIGLNRISGIDSDFEIGEQYRWSDGSKFEYRKWAPKVQETEADGGNCVYFGTMVGAVGMLRNGSMTHWMYSWSDGFAVDECGMLKMPMCKVVNLMSRRWA